MCGGTGYLGQDETPGGRVNRVSIVSGQNGLAMATPDNRRLRRFHGYFMAPRFLPAFPDAVPVRRMSHRMRWKDRRGLLYEWDSRHGTLEVYDAFGQHLGEFDAATGTRLNIAVSGRSIEL